MLAFSLCVLLPLTGCAVAGCWGIFTKAGQPGWASVVPGYNLFVLVQVAGMSWWWVLLFLIPFVNICIWGIVCDELSARFGKSLGHSMGLYWLSFVFFPLLGFGSAEYEDTGIPGRRSEDAVPRRRRRDEDEEPRPRRPRPQQREQW